MKLYIPRVGSCFKLLADREVNVIPASRNEDLVSACGLAMPHYTDRNPKHGKFTIPAGTCLVVDRVYIRQPAKSGIDNDYDSMTFLVKSTASAKLPVGSRFFVRLDDCNDMDIEVVGENFPFGLGADKKYKAEAEGRTIKKSTKPVLSKQTISYRNFSLGQLINPAYRSFYMRQILETSLGDSGVDAMIKYNASRGLTLDDHFSVYYAFHGKFERFENSSLVKQNCVMSFWANNVTFPCRVTFDFTMGEVQGVTIMIGKNRDIPLVIGKVDV